MGEYSEFLNAYQNADWEQLALDELENIKKSALDIDYICECGKSLIYGDGVIVTVLFSCDGSLLPKLLLRCEDCGNQVIGRELRPEL